jgi:hypothetical protein
MADKVGLPKGDLGPTREPSGGEGAQQFGLTAAMALIVGSIIGVGIFNLPASLLTAVFGIVPSSKLASANAPFPDAAGP